MSPARGVARPLLERGDDRAVDVALRRAEQRAPQWSLARAGGPTLADEHPADHELQARFGRGRGPGRQSACDFGATVELSVPDVAIMITAITAATTTTATVIARPDCRVTQPAQSCEEVAQDVVRLSRSEVRRQGIVPDRR